MGLAHNEIQVTWGAANSFDLATGNSWAQDSDGMTASTNAVEACIQLKADQTTGTPAAGDLVDFYLLATLGDPDGAVSDEYDSYDHAAHLARMDLNSDDPAIVTMKFPVPLKGFKIRAVGAGFAGTDVCTVSCCVLELTYS